MIDHVLDTIAPHICAGCRQVGGVLCNGCLYDINEEPFSVCMYCVTPTNSSNLCRPCRKTQAADEAYVVSWREGALKKLVDDYKFQRKKAVADVLANLIDDRLPVLPKDTIVTYVPTVRVHIRQRGYDHMRLIADSLAKKRGLQTQSLLIRRTQTVQRGADRALRLLQPKQAFGLHNRGQLPTVVLIDDIVTTGATLSCASKLLRPYVDGALIVAAIARQPLDDSSDLW